MTGRKGRLRGPPPAPRIRLQVQTLLADRAYEDGKKAVFHVESDLQFRMITGIPDRDRGAVEDDNMRGTGVEGKNMEGENTVPEEGGLKVDEDAGRGRINWSAAAGIFALSLVLCVSFARFAKPLPVTDEFLTYYRIATNVSDGKGFTEDGLRPYVYLPPLFSCALGGWFSLVGSRSLFTVQVYQSLCIAFGALLTFLLARELIPRSEGAAIAASLWVAIHPSLWTYSVFVRQEPTILLVTTLACWRTVKWLREPGGIPCVPRRSLLGLGDARKSGDALPAGTPVVPLGLARAERRANEGIGYGFGGDRVPAGARSVDRAELSPVPALHTGQRPGGRSSRVERTAQRRPGGRGGGVVSPPDHPVEDDRRDERGTRGGEVPRGVGSGGHERQGACGAPLELLFSHKKYFVVQRVRNAIFLRRTRRRLVDPVGAAENRRGAGQHSLPGRGPAVSWDIVPVLVWRLFLLAWGRLDMPMVFLVFFFLCYWGVYSILWGGDTVRHSCISGTLYVRSMGVDFSDKQSQFHIFINILPRRMDSLMRSRY